MTAPFTRVTIDEYAFDVGHIGPRAAMLLMPLLAQFGTSSTAVDQIYSGLLANTYYVKPDGKKQLVLKIAETVFLTRPDVIWRLFQQAREILYKGFTRGSNDSDSASPLPENPTESDETP